MFTVAERIFTDGERTFPDAEHTFTIGKHKLYRASMAFLVEGKIKNPDIFIYIPKFSYICYQVLPNRRKRRLSFGNSP